MHGPMNTTSSGNDRGAICCPDASGGGVGEFREFGGCMGLKGWILGGGTYAQIIPTLGREYLHYCMKLLFVWCSLGVGNKSQSLYLSPVGKYY